MNTLTLGVTPAAVYSNQFNLFIDTPLNKILSGDISDILWTLKKDLHFDALWQSLAP